MRLSLPATKRKPKPPRTNKPSSTSFPCALHALQRVHSEGNERARAFPTVE